MVISGIRTRNKKNGMISTGLSSGTKMSIPAQTNQLKQLKRSNIVRMRSGREIIREPGTSAEARGEEKGNPSRKRHWREEPPPRANNRHRNAVPRKAPRERRRGVLFGVEDDDDEESPRKRSILFWLVDSGTVSLDASVFYVNKEFTEILNQGKITKDGLLCGCCNRLLTMSEFEVHAGSKLDDPYRNIFLQSGKNLLYCQTAAWNRQDESALCSYNIIEDENETDQNDDTCGTCGEGGELICCDGCPSTYHQSCMGIEVLPPGDWICPCCKCKYCRKHQSEPENPVLTCLQCERKFHQLCSQDSGVKTNGPSGSSFCGQSCTRLFRRLKDLMGFNNVRGGGFTWSLNKRLDQNPRENIFRQTQRITCNSKLAMALKVMEECFDPISDPRTGVNMIQGVVYNIGSNLNRLDYTGFSTAILERGDEIISVASIRIHGTRLAEMPFIATRNMYRCQGMCRLLLQDIESTLRYLGVEKLVIPSVEERVQKWINGYGFQPVNDELRQEMKSMNLLTFPATVPLEKSLLPQAQQSTTTNADVGNRPAPFDLNLLPPDGN